MSRRDEVLEELRDAGAEGISGSLLAGRLGVSRMAVSKHVASLRDDGYDIGSRPGTGYALLGVPDAPLPAEVSRHLTGGMWVRLEGGGETVSTNTDAVARARAGAAHGTVVLAGRQSGGRGRLGRQWESPPGGVYVSAVLRPPLAPAALGGLPLAVAVGIVGALQGCGVTPLVKWPNDVRLGDAKLAGILLEMSAEADRTEWVVVGVGLNVRTPSQPAAGAAYLAEVVEGTTLPEAAALVLDGIETGYRMLVDDGITAVARAFGPLDALAGRSVCVRDIFGAVRAEGRAAGIDSEGRLLVETAAGATVALAAGDVTLAG